MSTAEIKSTVTATDEPEKLDLRSFDISDEKRAELLALFPEARTEGGKIDFARLQLALGETVDVGKERYGMNWPGKADCFRTIQTPSVGTLRPAPEESVNFDTTENLIIEGDNLEVLKLLQKSYLGKIKMIYIDPPYNTGNDFIYPDNYSESLETYLEYTGQVDTEGKKFGTNTDADGRFHSKWLNMMYPRLYLARNLLRDDGVIFISIDDGEYVNLHKLCSEVFGEENFIATIIWQKNYSGKADATHFARFHEYQLCYARDFTKLNVSLLPRTDEMNSRYTNPDNDPRGPWLSNDLTAAGERTGGHYPIQGPSEATFDSPQGKHWLYARSTMEEMLQDNRIWFGSNGTAFPRLKRFLSEVQQGRRASTIWMHEEVGHTDEATKEFRELFKEEKISFSAPKPTRLIEQILRLTTSNLSNDIVLDFFAGSGTSAQAVLELNKKDGGNREFILVQLPELCADDSEAKKAGFGSIAEIAKERTRRVIASLNNSEEGKLNLDGGEKPHDRGFRVYKLAQSNFTTWDAEGAKDTTTLATQLDLHVDHIRQQRTDEDILYELLLKSGFPLTTPVEKKTVEGKTIYTVASGALVICLDRALTLELIRAIADMKPERVVCLDEGFAGNDQLKTNAVQTFKTKGITSFKTV